MCQETAATSARSASEFQSKHDGKLVIIYGNGPSLQLTDEFRDQLAKHVSVGINYSYKFLPSTYYAFTEWDTFQFGTLAKEIGDATVFCPRRFAETGHIAQLPGDWLLCDQYVPVNGRPISESFDEGVYYSIRGRSTIYNSGVFGVNIAHLLGAKAIALIGFDMLNDGHFYDNEGKNRKHYCAVVALPALHEIADYLRKRGIEAYNCAPEEMSAVTNWTRISLADLLKEQ